MKSSINEVNVETELGELIGMTVNSDRVLVYIYVYIYIYYCKNVHEKSAKI